MHNKKIIALSASLLVGLTIVGCSQNKQTPVEPTPQAKVEENTTAERIMNKEEYKTYFVENYDKYLNNARIEDMYTTDALMKGPSAQTNYPGNEAYYNNYLTNYTTVGTNMNEFVNQFRNIKVEDPELDKLNKELITRGETLSTDINDYTTRIDKESKNLVKMGETEFFKGLNDIERVGETTRTDFDKIMKDIRNSLGIK